MKLQKGFTEGVEMPRGKELKIKRFQIKEATKWKERTIGMSAAAPLTSEPWRQRTVRRYEAER
ncbi:hypothetical protein RUM43_005065 [Polyplax serrata]|uniref:Uncharacterized protein n=1 Tax=Polyplax serrata TaxID=468196 RepID=A0AAN8XMX4_POLSC